MSATLLEILKFTIPSIIVFIATYVIMRSFHNKEYKIKRMEYKMANLKESLPLRFQAYERLTLFLERISFNNLLYRVRGGDMNTREFQMALLESIRSEFGHNVTQQIYVSGEIWNMTKAVKEEVISIINRIGQTIPPEAPSKELSRKIFAYLIESEQATPTSKALDAIKNEIKELY